MEIVDQIKNCDKSFKKFEKSKLHTEKQIYNPGKYKAMIMIFNKKKTFFREN